MACRSAAWVLGGVRLISSASRMLAKMGPLTNRNSRLPDDSSRTMVPVMSEGIRSGVNWTRLKDSSMIWLILLTSKVLAKPGTPIKRQCPRVNTAARICSMTSDCPTITLRSCSIISWRDCANCWRYSVILSELTAAFPDVNGRQIYSTRIMCNCLGFPRFDSFSRSSTVYCSWYADL